MSRLSVNQAVIAGAGTGKTHLLVNTYIQLLQDLKSAKPILALTFTEKATLEMKERIAHHLKDKPVLLHDFLSHCHIHTFHGFCSQFLREEGHVIGLFNSFTLLDEWQEQQLLYLCAEKTLIEQLQDTTKSIASLEDLASRFQLKKSGDMPGLLDDLIDLHHQISESGIEISELQSVSPKLSLKDWPKNLPKGRQLFETLYEQKQTAALKAKLETIQSAFDAFYQSLSEFLKENTLDDKSEIKLSFHYTQLKKSLSGRFGQDGLRKACVDWLLQMGSSLCDIFCLPQLHAFKELFLAFEQKLIQEKYQRQSLSFGDLLTQTKNILMTQKELQKQYQMQFKYVLVDEYQDTSPIQEDLIALLCQSVEDNLQPKNPLMEQAKLAPSKLMIVGDPKQSIYGFRGTDARVFWRTAHVIEQQQGEKIYLNESRRTVPALLDPIHQVAKATLHLNPFGVPFTPDQILKPTRENHPQGYFEKITLKEDQTQEQAVLETLTHLIKIGILPHEIGILTRRSKMARQYAFAIKAAGFPMERLENSHILEQPEVGDIIYLLRLLLEPENSIALFALFRSPLFNITEEDILSIVKQHADWNLDELGLLSGLTPLFKQSLFSLRDFLERNKPLLFDLTPAQVLDEALQIYPLKTLKTLEYLSFQTKHTTAYEWILELLAWQESGYSPKGFPLNQNPAEKGIQVMTIHQSKGLEFRAVILADLGASEPHTLQNIAFDRDLGLAMTHKARPISACAPKSTDEREKAQTLLDQVRHMQKQKTQAELARLLYVAMTRAKDILYVIEPEKPQNNLSSLYGLFLKASL